MVQTPLDLLNRAAEDANGLFDVLPGLAGDGAAKYVKDGTPSGVIPNLGVGLARAACRRYGANPGAVSGRVATGFERVCRPYLDNIGEGDGPLIELPFRGGQCPAVYIVSATRTSNLAGTGSITFRALGPVGGVRLRQVSGNNYDWEVFCSGANFAQTTCGTMPAGEPAWYRIGGINSSDGNQTTSITSITPCGADNCGNPAPIVTQPKTPTIPVPIIIPIILQPDVNIDVEVDIDVDGRITFDIGPDSVTINPFGGDGGDGGGGGTPPPSLPAPEPGLERPGGNGGFGGDDMFGAPPAGRRWVGCCIRLTAVPINQPPIPGSIPEDVYASVVGNIRLVFNAAGKRQTDTPIRVLAKHVCVWEPVAKLNPVGVSVDLLAGFGYTYTPYSVPLEA